MLMMTTEGIRELNSAVAFAIQDMDNTVQDVMEEMGPQIANMMTRAMAPHRYTGELSESVQWEYKSAQKELHVGSDLMRKNYNATALLEGGTGDIPAVPFGPIAVWADFRGLPAGPVWMSIKQKGIQPHPIRDPIMTSPEFTSLVQAGNKKLGEKILLKAFTYEIGVNP